MRLIGGLILLNLTSISLGLTSGEVSITDEEVLKQLEELRNFIDEKRDFTKGFKDLKPVLVQYRSSASKIDGVVQCNMSFNTDALHMSIAGYSVQADGTPITIRINVEYEWVNYVGYQVKTAKLEATKEFNVDYLKSNWETNEDITLNSVWLNGVTASGVYSKLLVKNGVMYIVISALLTNETESSITISADKKIFEKVLDEDVASLIYRKDGTNVSVNAGGVYNILVTEGKTSSTGGGSITAFTCSLNSESAKVIYLYPRTGITLNAGSSVTFDVRFFITL